MNNKKLLKVLSTSFILGTILMTNPTGAEKVSDEAPLSENVSNHNEDEKEVKDEKAIENEKEVKDEKAIENEKEVKDEKAIENEKEVKDEKSEVKDEKSEIDNVVSKETKADKQEEKEKEESTNNGSTDKLELSSDTEKEAVSSDEKAYKDEFFKKPIVIDNIKNYDFTKYFKENIKDKDDKGKSIKYEYTIDDRYSKSDDNGKSIERQLYTTLVKGRGMDSAGAGSGIDANTLEKQIIEKNSAHKENLNVVNDETVKKLGDKYRDSDTPISTYLYVSDDFTNSYIVDDSRGDNKSYVILLNKEDYNKHYDKIRRIVLGDALLDNNDYDRMTYLYARSGYKTLPKNLRGNNDTSDENKTISGALIDQYTGDKEGYRQIAMTIGKLIDVQSKYKKNKTVYVPSDQLKLNEKKSTNKSIYHITQAVNDPIYKENNEIFSKNLTDGIYSTNPEDKHLIFVGNVDNKIENVKFKTIKKEDPTLAEGETKIQTSGKAGRKVTKITYEVDENTGKLKNPKEKIVEDTKPVDEIVLVGTKKVIPAKPIEDIATTTKTTKEIIKAEISYEADDTLEFEKQNAVTKSVDGEKEITSKTTSGKTTKTEKVIKGKVDGLTKVGNKKVVTEDIKVEGKDAKKITTTIYEVDKKTGKLVNPKSTVKTILNAEKIQDIAKKVIPAKKIEDIAKKTIPAAKIEDIAKKTIPAAKIEDIAKKNQQTPEEIDSTELKPSFTKDNKKPAEKPEEIDSTELKPSFTKDDKKPAEKPEEIDSTELKPSFTKDDNNHRQIEQAKKPDKMPKAGIENEISLLAAGALSTIAGLATLKKKRR